MHPRMSGRKNPGFHENEALREYRHFESRARGERIVGDSVPGMDILAPPRADAATRRPKHRENFRR